MTHRRGHYHFCTNRKKGCEAKWLCMAGWYEDDCGRHCASDIDDDLPCDACEESPRCNECGAMEIFSEAHYRGCSLDPADPENRDDSPEAKLTLITGIEMLEMGA